MNRKTFLTGALATGAMTGAPLNRAAAKQASAPNMPPRSHAEYVGHDATALAKMIRERVCSPKELLDLAMARFEAVNPRVNAVIQAFPDLARRDIDTGLPAGPLTGVPFLVKDLRVSVKGMRTTSGSRALADAPVAKADSPLVSDFRAGGLVIFGKTNVPEFGIDVVTEPDLYGPTRNPWNLARAAGGSSGGAAAAVAAGIVPAAHGNDGGGSLRLPASACGVFALKPTRGRVSMAPDREGWGGMSTQNCVTRSVRDSALLLDLICRPEPGDAYWRDPPETSYSRQILRPPKRLRIAFSTATFQTPTLDPECATAVRDAASMCSKLGHHVEEATPQADYNAMSRAMTDVLTANVAASIIAIGRSRGRDVQENEVEADSWYLSQAGRRLSAADYIRALDILNTFTRQFVTFFQRYDILIMSTAGRPPPLIGAFKGATAASIRTWATNTNAFNISGQPAMSLPLAFSKDGLPIGVQFAARADEDGLLLQLAAEIEQAHPWFNRMPLL